MPAICSEDSDLNIIDAVTCDVCIGAGWLDGVAAITGGTTCRSAAPSTRRLALPSMYSSPELQNERNRGTSQTAPPSPWAHHMKSQS